jgi:peptidoglycan/LPS O-acetylase OafA/YrhL
MLVAHERSAEFRNVKYRPDIDGLRALAITSVVANHCGLQWALGGFLGVDVFFVISGYLIGSQIYKEIRAHNFSVARFYARRAKRILPALVGVLFFCYVATFLLLPPVETKLFSESALAAIVSSSNIFFSHSSQGYFSPDTALSPLLMTWSLGVEEQFYILFPMLMLLLHKLRWRSQFLWIGGLAALSLVLSSWGALNHPIPTFFLLPTRAWELAAGILLALFEAHPRHDAKSMHRASAHGLSIVGFALIIFAIGAFGHNALLPGFAVWLPVAGAVLMIGARNGIANDVLSWRPITFVGKVSYSWYLWHWPIASFVRNIADTSVSTSVGVAIGLVSFGLAVLSYLFVETPFRASKTPPRLLLLRYGGLVIVTMIPPAVFYFSNGLPHGNSAAQQAETIGQALISDPCIIRGAFRMEPCIPPGEDGPAVALIGDSHAAALAGALRTISERSGYRLLEIVKAACPPLEAGVTPSYINYPLIPSDCSKYNRDRLSFVEHDPSVRVVVLAADWSEPLSQVGGSYIVYGQRNNVRDHANSLQLLQMGLDELITRMENKGITVYILQDNPNYSFDPQIAILNRLIPPRRILSNLAFGSQRPETQGLAPNPDSPITVMTRTAISDVAAQHPNVHLIDLRSAFCSGDWCRFADGDNGLYIDPDHLSPLGAQIALSSLHLPSL